VFDLDLEQCPDCGGQLKIIAAILEQPTLRFSVQSESLALASMARTSTLCRRASRTSGGHNPARQPDLDQVLNDRAA
jgi:hypothetical protein